MAFQTIGVLFALLFATLACGGATTSQAASSGQKGVATTTVVRLISTTATTTALAVASASSVNCSQGPKETDIRTWEAVCGHQESDILPQVNPGQSTQQSTTSSDDASSSHSVTSAALSTSTSETSSNHIASIASATNSAPVTSSPTSTSSLPSNTAATTSESSADNQQAPKRTPSAALAAGISFGAIALIAAIAGVLWRKRNRWLRGSESSDYPNEKDDFSPTRYNYGGRAFYEPERFQDPAEMDGEPKSAGFSSSTAPREVEDLGLGVDGLTHHGSNRRTYMLMNPDPPSSATTDGPRARSSLPFSEEGREDEQTSRPSPTAGSMVSPVPSDAATPRLDPVGRLSPLTPPPTSQAWRPQSITPSMYGDARDF